VSEYPHTTIIAAKSDRVLLKRTMRHTNTFKKLEKADQKLILDTIASS